MWPVRIYQDRYGGSYSGGAWVAVDMARKEMEISEIETGILGGDTQAMQFWLAVADADWIAVGRTPDIALAALEAKQSAPPRSALGLLWRSQDDKIKVDRAFARPYGY
jgi:hypothetical protein